MDIKEEIAKAFAAEEIQQEITRLRTPPRTTLGKISEFFESKFGGWFLGTVLVGVFTFGWGAYQERCGSIYLQKEETRIRDEVQEQEAAKQAELTKGREDAAFLGQMFIETSKDEGEKKCRIAQLMQLRNADCNDESKSAPCQWLRQFKKEIQAKDGDIESCVTVLKNEAIAEGRAAIKNSENNSQAKGSLITENPAAAKIIQKLPPRAYIQIFDERDRERSQDLKGKLQANNFIVPAVENVGDDNGNRAKPLAKNIIRCYNQVDCDKISSISKIVAPDFEVQQIPGNTNFGSIEFWYKAP